MLNNVPMYETILEKDMNIYINVNRSDQQERK